MFEQATRVIPGGVNSPVRAFGAVGGTPLIIKQGKGSRIFDQDGREYIDFCCSWGPLILGHAYPDIVSAVQKAAANGLSFGIHTEAETQFAEMICNMVREAEKVRLVNSGTEATMTALRIARGATNRNAIVKFDGCYHGHNDALLVAAGSGLLTAGKASSAGIPSNWVEDVYVLPYNDLPALDAFFAEKGETVAAVIVEPVAGNMGLIPPREGFLEKIRELTTRHGALLIYDEVITGFRFAPSTFATLHGHDPDLVCLGKIIGGGMPIGAVAGKQRYMDLLAPLGPVYQAGTLSGNPVAVAAGLTTLRILQDQSIYRKLESLGSILEEKLTRLQEEFSPDQFAFRCLGSAFTIFMQSSAPMHLEQAKRSDTERFARFFHHMLDHGIYLPPSQFETCFLSLAHTEADINSLIDAFHEFLIREQHR